MTEEQIKAFRDFGAACQRTGEIIAEALQPLFDVFMETCRKLYAWFHDRYTEAGAIYGDTHEGMLRWYRELATIARLRQEANTIEQRHRTIADFQ